MLHNEHNKSLPRIGERLAQLRRTYNMTQEALAEYLGVSRQAVSKWESDLAYPETDKLIRLSRLYGCTVDYLLTGELESLRDDTPKEKSEEARFRIDLRSKHYEYKSRRTVRGVPLVHVNIGLGRCAHGLIAIGLRARGLVAVGLMSMGVVSLGVMSLGILAFGSLALGILALGSIAVGLAALGGIAIGVIALGGVAVGLCATGGVAVGSYIAVGDWAYGQIALGQTYALGDLFEYVGDVPTDVAIEVRGLIDAHTPAFLRGISHVIFKLIG